MIRVAPPDVGYVSKLRGSSGAAAHVRRFKTRESYQRNGAPWFGLVWTSVVVGVETSGVGPLPDRVGGASRLKGMNLACDNRKALTNLKLASPSNWTQNSQEVRFAEWGVTRMYQTVETGTRTRTSASTATPG